MVTPRSHLHYRIRPGHLMLDAAPTVASEPSPTTDEDPTSLDALPWRSTLVYASDDVLTIALQTGWASSTGLVVEGAELVVLAGGESARRQGEAQATGLPLHIDPARQALAAERWDHGQHHTAATAQLLDEARRQALARPWRAELAEHWQARGGRLPTPR